MIHYKLLSLFLALFSFLSLDLYAEDFCVSKALMTKLASRSVFANDFLEFRNLNVNDGFTRNSIFKIFQDQTGFIWLGSWDGLYRYDGSQLKHMYPSNKRKSKKQHIITEIVEDDHHRIWIGGSYGIVVWDAESEKILPFSELVASGELPHSNVKSLCKDKEGNIWIVTHSDLYVYHQTDQSLHNISYLWKEDLAKVNGIYADNDNNIWMKTNGSGVLKIEKDEKKTAGMSKGGHWKLCQDSLFEQIQKGNVIEMFQDSQHDYWLAINRGIVHVVKHRERGLDECSAKNTLYLSSDGSLPRVSSFAEGDGCVYAATNKGLFAYSLNFQKHTWIEPDYSVAGSLTDKNLKDVMVDREGGLWIGTYYGGVNYLPPTSGNFSTYIDVNKYLQGHVVSGIAEDCRGNLWFGVEDGGVAMWEWGSARGHTFTPNSKTAYHPARPNVQCVYADNKNVYVGTFLGGMDIIDVSTLTSRNLNPTNTKPDALSSSIYSFCKISDSFLFIGALNGLYVYDMQKDEVHKDPVVTGKVNCIIRDDVGHIWVSTIGRGIYRFTPSLKEWRHFTHDVNDSTSLVCNDINTLYAVNSSIYLGTQGHGVWEYRQADDRFYPVAEEVLGDALIFKLLPFYDSFWITTNKGLFSYNRVTRQINQFTAQDGLRSNLFKENSGIITSDGLYVIGGVNGVNFFKPSRLKWTLRKPEVMLTELALFNKPVNCGQKNSPLQRSITYSDRLEINQKHNNISIRFSSSSYNSPNKNLYQYKLEPFDKEWQRTTQLNNVASYTNLPAGNYVFKVRTANGISDWSDEKCLQLKVNPYWWLSLPMQALYVLVFFLGLLLYLRHFQHKKKEEMRLFRYEKEQETYRSKMEFFTCVVHEIRTPLTLILGPLSRIMQKSGSIEEVRPELHIIERNGNRLLSLVNQLMDFRKVEEKSYAVQLSVVNLKELVGQIVNEFRLYKMHKTVDFEVNLCEDDCWANIDREAFTKVLVNLLSNAMKFTNDHVEVGIEAANGKMQWRVYVRDNGCGIAQQHQSSIFESFYQVRQDMPSDYIGTGIGLFVVRRLLELQGGSIHLESRLNEGSCFSAVVQRADAPLVQQLSTEQLQEQTNEYSENNGEATRKHLLVVEDNTEMRKYIMDLLSEKFQVDACENGKVALDFMNRNEYDLVITDLMMPVMDGMSLCRQLKSQSATSHIPVIILTAKDDEMSQKEGFESEADLYVTKPFSAEVLLSQVKSVIRNRERMRKKFYSEPEATTEVLCTNDTDKAFLEKFDELISQRLENCNLSVDEFASEMALGRSVFYQKVKGVTGLTPNDYIRTFRLKKAATLFQNGETRISEVCYRVGFSSPSYFTKRFTMQFGISPSDYLKKLGRE